MTARRMAIGAVLLLATTACARAHTAPTRDGAVVHAARGEGDSQSLLELEQTTLARLEERLRRIEPSADPVTIQQPQRQLIRNGEMNVRLRDPIGAAGRIEARVAAAGGFVESSEREGDGSSAQLQLRVPSTMLDAFMDSVGAMGQVRNRSVSARDVTDQLVDLDARRATLVATRDRLRELLRRADAVRDVVEVERELTRVQGQLDSMDRQLEAMRGRVALSQLSVRFDRAPVLGPLGLVFYGAGKVIEKLFVWRT